MAAVQQGDVIRVVSPKRDELTRYVFDQRPNVDAALCDGLRVRFREDVRVHEGGWYRPLVGLREADVEMLFGEPCFLFGEKPERVMGKGLEGDQTFEIVSVP